MTEAVAQTLHEVEDLPRKDCAHLEEVRRRIAQVEAGEVTLVPGEQALGQVRRLVA